MNEEKAASYLLLAWIKDWTMIDLAKTILETSKDVDFNEVNQFFPFMPSEATCYFVIKQGRKGVPRVKKFVADNYPKLTDHLWNCANNKEIMASKDRVLRLVCQNIPPSNKFSKEDQKENVKASKEMRAESASYKISREIFKKSSGHDWNTIK